MTLTEMTRRVDANIDQQVAVKACRAIAREAASRIALIGAATPVMGVEEVTLADAFETALSEYLRGKQDRAATRSYLGMTRGLDDIEARASALSEGAAA